MNKIALFALLLSASTASQAGSVEDLSAVLNGRIGSSSEDRRHDVNQDIGITKIRIGCKGDTLESNVQITGVSGKLEGDTAVMSVTYSGSYTRQGWDIPCQKISSNLGGVENRNVSGTYQFRVTGKAFQKPTITWGSGSGFGEVADAGHDSNVFAVRAVQNAIASAF
ncbi:hypothetical protein H9L17_04980 [Thermomonas brevis]|uniref:Uncharacterized protein n=1 Tax=Thermomonas brevis TaxID=215691 RepID=A0A7G9QVX0_9GAMM|nr:hypothetical protein [Thermomonas brevis]QNN47495.1 hypothetical protein H9L17_04980 [Thermomonas brevis]